MQQDLHPSLSQQNIAASLLSDWWSSNSLVQEKFATHQIFHAIHVLQNDEKSGNATDVFSGLKIKK